MLNVLFPSAGRRVELLRLFRRAYQSLGLAGRVIATDIDPLAPALQEADRTYIVPAIASPDYVSSLIEICRRERVSAIFPVLDPDIPVLSANRAVIESTGARLAVVRSEAAAITTDKCLTEEFFRSLGLQTARAFSFEELHQGPANYPLFIKPRQGSAAKHAYRVLDAHDLAFFMGYVPDPMIQEYLPGPEITNDVICDLDGQLMAVVSRRRLEVRNGEVTKGVTTFDREIHDACVKIAEALPAVGPITVQCMMKEGVPYFTEINARLGGGVPLAVAAGVDVPAMLLARLAGLPSRILEAGGYELGLHMVRFDNSLFLREMEREQMAGRHL